jgi:hypothetical protein
MLNWILIHVLMGTQYCYGGIRQNLCMFFIEFPKKPIFLMLLDNNTFIIEEKLYVHMFMVWNHYVE